MSEKTTATVKATGITKALSRPQNRSTEGSGINHSPRGQILFLQNTVGNQAVQRLFKSGRLQAQFRIGPPNDIYEQEADRVADQVMRMSEKAISSQRSSMGKENGDIQLKPA